MKMKLKTTIKDEFVPLFFNIEVDQFFIDANGQLCQKIDDNSCNTIADANNDPYATYVSDVDQSMEVTPLDTVTKVTWS